MSDGGGDFDERFEDEFGEDFADDDAMDDEMDLGLDLDLAQEDDLLAAKEQPGAAQADTGAGGAPLDFRRIANASKAVPPDQRQTSKYMTKYEKARILGTRALQISKNAPILVTPEKGVTDPLRIAEQELHEKKLPFIVRRNLPGGYYEDWKIHELLID